MKTQPKHSFSFVLSGLLIIGLVACTPSGQNDTTDIQNQPPVSKESQTPNSISEEETTSLIPGQSQGSLPVFNCTETQPHPIGQSIADMYDNVSYEQVMTWFCNGYTFDDILVALETSAATDIPAADLLLWEKSWEEIWQETGFLKE